MAESSKPCQLCVSIIWSAVVLHQHSITLWPPLQSRGGCLRGERGFEAATMSFLGFFFFYEKEKRIFYESTTARSIQSRKELRSDNIIPTLCSAISASNAPPYASPMRSR
ncbi:hypothetical protein CBL_11869 [Carabus blaptoides fortunei]